MADADCKHRWVFSPVCFTADCKTGHMLLSGLGELIVLDRVRERGEEDRDARTMKNRYSIIFLLACANDSLTAGPLSVFVNVLTAECSFLSASHVMQSYALCYRSIDPPTSVNM